MSLSTFIISSFSSPAIYFQYVNSSCKSTAHDQAKLIVSKAKSLSSKVGQREKLISDSGNWFLMRANNDLLFCACVEEQYPERVAFGLIEEVKKFLKEQAKEDAEAAIKTARSEINNICEGYKDSRVDKLMEAQQEVNQLRGQLRKSVKKIMDNQQAVQNLCEKSEGLKSFAKQFEKGAVVVQKNEFMKKWKMYFIVGSAAFLFLALVSFVIYRGLHHN